LRAKAKFCSGHHSFRKINTRRRHNSQLAPSQTQKIKNRLGGLGSHLRNYRKWKQENYGVAELRYDTGKNTRGNPKMIFEILMGDWNISKF
jgi:hypothetical protein